MRRTQSDSHRGILIVALMMGVLIGSLIIVALIRLPINAGVLANSFGPCTYFVQKQSSQYIVTAQIAIGGLIAGQQVTSPSTNDFGAFFQNFINNEVQIGHGNNCLDNAEYDISSSSTCNMTAPSQTCGLLMRGHALFFTCPGYGYARESFGNPATAAGITPCVIKYTGTSTITCLICYGQFQGTTEWDGGGMLNVGVDGNGISPALVNDCIEAFNVHAFRFYQGFSVNCLSNDIRTGGAEAGGVSDIHITDSLFGAQAAITTGVCVNLDFGTGQSWVQGNFFAAQCFGYNILANGAGNGFGNKIIGNQVEACAQGTGGQVKAGTCIYDLDSYDTIQFNTMFNGVDYDCIYGSAQGQFITTNSCQGPINQQNNADGSCYAVDNAVNTASFTAIAENQCIGVGGHLNYCVYINGNAIANTHNMTIQNNRCSGWQSGGRAIALTGTFDGATMLVSSNPGNWQPPVQVTAGTSTWTYTNVDGYQEIMDLKTVNGIQTETCFGITTFPITQDSVCSLVPGATMIVTWITTAPVYVKEFTNP